MDGIVKWYFAYGRNVNIATLCKRINGYPLIISRALLPGYELRFNKYPGPKPGTGYSNIVPRAESFVEGVLYLLRDEDFSRLGRFEGVPSHYVEERVTVWDVDRRAWVEATTYVAVNTDDALKPPREYLEEIIKAAKTMGLSEKWIEILEGFRSQAV